MDERPDNHMELITWRMSRRHCRSNRGTRVFLRVEGLRNVWRETSGTVVAEV